MHILLDVANGKLAYSKLASVVLFTCFYHFLSTFLFSAT